MKNKDELEDEIKSLARKRDEVVLKLNKLQEELIEKSEEYYALDPEMVKIICIGCAGTGYIKEGEKKQLCRICGGKQYNWVKRFKEN